MLHERCIIFSCGEHSSGGQLTITEITLFPVAPDCEVSHALLLLLHSRIFSQGRQWYCFPQDQTRN